MIVTGLNSLVATSDQYQLDPMQLVWSDVQPYQVTKVTKSGINELQVTGGTNQLQVV